MTWEETIEMIRGQEAYKDLVVQAYFDKNLSLNVQRFAKSEEFTETLKIINQYQPNATSILDIGSGNGISAINFALKGYKVTVVEPDKSNTVGSGAIRILKDDYKLDNLTIYDSYAEDIHFDEATFDVVYIRQAMHHANDLKKFIKEAVRVLKPNGLLLTVRDHVIYNPKDKQWFLESHPLHKFYGGENAYTAHEYKQAIVKAGATIKKELKYYDSVINYFPLTREEKKGLETRNINNYKNQLKKKIGFLVNLPFVFYLYKLIKGIDVSKILDETKIPGRMYTYIAIKK